MVPILAVAYKCLLGACVIFARATAVLVMGRDDFATATGADNTVAAGSVDDAACATFVGLMTWRLLTC